MKKLFLILILFTFCSCLGTRTTTEKTSDKVTTEKVEKTSDSISKEIVNKKIDDVITVEVPVSDPETNRKIEEILRKLNTKKTSGDNSYRLYYDEKLNELRAEFEIGETKSSEIETTNDTNTEKSFEETITENTKKVIKIVPWWAWVIVTWLLRHQIIGIISIFFPGVKGIKTIGDLLNPPNRDEHD